jgi:creatinine amidohydrolase
MEEKVIMENMSWVEIKNAIANGKTNVILVSGAIEQHGPHLPTGTDTILGYEIAKRAAIKLGNALVAPVIRPCLSEHHIGFQGSITLNWRTYIQVLEDHCESLSKSGFKDLFLISSHGGNCNFLTAITPDIARKFHTIIDIHLIDNLRLSHDRITEFLEKQGISKTKAGVHSGYAETSEMLVVRPDLVNMNLAEKGLDDESFYEPKNIPKSQIDSFIYGIKHFSPNGILGDPRGANRETGEKLLEISVDVLVNAISEMLNN